MKSFAWLALGVFLVGGCKGEGETPTVAAAPGLDRLQKAEADVLSRRKAIAEERKEVLAARRDLAVKREEVLAKGGDTSELDQKDEKLAARLGELEQQEASAEQEMVSLLRQTMDMVSTVGGDGMSRREAAVAAREKDFARREQEMAQREAELARREAALARREKEMCGGPGTVQTIVQQVPVPAGKYTRRDVEPVLRRALRTMAQKGILTSDLPGPAQDLESQAHEAMADGDYSKAKFAADQLYGTVRSMKIDKGFIAAKIQRLNAAIKGKRLGGSAQKEVDELFAGATSDYGDGRFSSANAKLNKIYSVIR